ncbi:MULTISPECIES: sensor histidine kinase [Sphingomonadales]|uniref:histidine kinase n=1 Tax=Sphingobium naphthae TaxID=1886786 RepID=A0ABU4A1B8_9SPHN|nr:MULTISPECIES: ATP-binding protein [Sphingomonadaceae]MDV5825530.1 ATP-binding protein [Sphingobium naphthae]
MLRRLWRSTFGVVALVAIGFAAATLAIGAIAYIVTHEALEKQLDHRVSVETDALLQEVKEGGIASVAESIRLREATRTTSSLDYLLVDKAGRSIAATVTPLVPVRAGYEEFFRFRRDGYTGIGQSLTTALPGGMLVVIADRRDLKEIDRTLEILFAGALGAMLALGVGAAALIGWLTRRRLARIDATAKAIIAGDLAQRVARDGSESEFDQLAATLNQMLDRMAALMDNLRQVSSDVAHDLRTPLTRLCNQLERASTGQDDDERVDAIHAARDQANELLEIFAALLRIAEVEGLAERRALAPVDLSALLDEMVDTYRPDFEAADRRLVAAISTGLQVRGDRRLLAQAVSNLLENALRHTPAGTTATLSASGSGEAIDVELADDGPGVPSHEADRLFQRFARAEASRTTAGHGLGLALVRAVAVGHGGDAILSRSTGGFAVSLRLTRSH